MITLPVRKTLPHDVPAWVADGAIFFVTINALPRGENVLASTVSATSVWDAFRFRHDLGEWYLWLLVVMPDHVHALISFPPESSMRRLMANTKHFLAKETGVVWQHGFFDPRLRREESLQDKWRYIRENPVRKGLVDAADKWPYAWQ